MPTENRSVPRIELLAQVQVSSESEIYIMSTTNISLGGVFIQGDPVEHPEIHTDMLLELVIFAAGEVDASDVHVAAKVIRIAGDEGAGFGLQFVSITDQQTQALELLIRSVD